MNPRRSNWEACNLLFPLLAVFVVFFVTGFCFDFYYQLNDDVVIKDILSGAYTGIPDGHTNQLLFPLGAVIALLYRLFSGLNCFAWFLLGCFGVCFYLVGYRSIKYYQRYSTKTLTLLLEAGIFLTMFLWELIYVQYSVVCGVMTATACFWFYTTDTGLPAAKFWYANLPALVLVWLSFGLRSEMTMLMSPYLCVAGIWHWSRQVEEEGTDLLLGGERKLVKRIFSVDNCRKYVLFVAAAVFGCGLLLAGDHFANAEDDWKAYRRFFDARTEVYDYTWYPSYEENQEFYDDIGVSREQYGLIDSYNFALDNTIDARMLEDIASFDERAKNQGSLLFRLKNGIWELLYRCVSYQDAPYNYFVLAGYALVIGLAVIQREKGYIWKLILLAAARVVPWMYLILAGRVVDRIAHPLYLAEFMCLMALLIKELYDRPMWNVERIYRRAVLGILAGFILVSGLLTFPRVSEEQRRREQVNATMEDFREYTMERPDRYYYLDVYSTVAYSEKLFDQNGNTQKNYDILGGWVCRSPLQTQVIEEYTGQSGMTVAQALLEDNFSFCVNSEEETGSVTDYYEALGTPVELTETDRVGSGEDILIIYRLEPVSGEQTIEE